MEEVIARLGLINTFDLKIAMKDFPSGRHKDDPEIFHIACEVTSGSRVSPFVMFEDGKAGIV